MESLTDKQQAVLDFIAQRTEAGNLAPSIREIASHLGLATPSAAHQHVRALQRKGWLKSETGLARAWQLTQPKAEKRITGIPLLGYIPAGHGDTRTQEPEGMIYMDLESLHLPRGSRIFALRVTGDSMIGKHIQNGDVVILEQNAEPQAGEVVAALIDGQSTLKTFVKSRGRSFLRAENPRYPDLIPAGELLIQGVMRMLVRDTRMKVK